jgi:hypothetical protein
MNVEKRLKGYRERSGDSGVWDDIWGTDSGFKEVGDERKGSG